jgi:hypothetical protein
MPNLLILGGPRNPKMRPNLSYRGTFRMHPSHFDEVSEQHEANQLFYWFLNEGEEIGVVSNIGKAARLRDLSNTSAKKTFELVEVLHEGERSDSNGHSLGFDISLGYNHSLLWKGLNFTSNLESSQPSRLLAKSVYKDFSSELNANGLFPNSEIASSFHGKAVEIQELEPNFFESDDLLKYAVVEIIHIQ